MKAKVLFLMMVCLASFSLGGYAQDKKEKKNNKEEVVFDVSLHCDNCKKKIEKNIPFEKGVSNLKVDLDSKTVMVQYNPQKTDKLKLQQAIEKLGYEAKEIAEQTE
ncbi:MAG TPA: hypothetical protein DIT04_06800 [Dysgonomonas sp.]|nr:hypothetical protein [Dysgonomonas sp.]